jgi:glycosyltransferase involved in cell wall biosynthesis
VRIAYILTCLGVGGAEKQTIAVAERMAARGHTVALVALTHHAGEELPVRLPVLRLNMRKSAVGMWKGSGFGGQFLAAFAPDVVHSHTYPANLFARLLRFRGLKAPVVNTIHNVYEGGWGRMLLYRLTGGLVDEVTAVSGAAAERFVRMGAVVAGKMRVLTNGVDTVEFAPERAVRRRVRKELGADERFVWLAVGRLAAAKDYPNLLRAFEWVRGASPGVELWIAGAGDPAGAGIASWPEGVRWLGVRSDVRELLDAADGFVLGSAWEGMPLAVAEAMAMERPVVATDVGGVRELVGDAGVVVAPGDSAALGEAMGAVMARPAEARSAQGRRARARMQGQFSLTARVEEWEAIYRELAG